ncbi:hypothetical protein lerEdw1_001507 [Lerista edwardsae]|nr:hypothetical protein lerEdw1_001507 [Lerista edwardsae]
MKLLLRLAFLGLLCFHAYSWVLKRDNHSEPLKQLAQLKNRELFLSALQSYMSSKGIQVNKTAPAFVLNSIDHNKGTHGTQEEQEVLDSKLHD